MSGFTVPTSGDVIAGRYSVEGVVGTGGVGVVLAAVHLELGHQVAIKILRNSTPATVERFRREARIVAKLQSEHVARVTDFGQLPDGSPFVVMDLLDGKDLDAELRARGPLPITEAVDYILSACEAIAEAHAAGIVHRDIKPKNLFLARKVGGMPVLKVLDFGLAKVDPLENASVTRTEDIFGSPAYMAPEQMRSARDVDARADIWALGITLYELLTGKPPFDAGSVPETCALVLREPTPSIRAVRPEVSAVLAKVIERCLEKDPEARFASVHSLVQRLEAFGPPHHEGITKRIEAITSAPRSERITSIETPPRAISRAPLPTLGSQESQDLSVEIKTDGSGPIASSSVPQGPARSRRGAALFALAVIAAGGVAAGVMATRRPHLDTTRAIPRAETPTAQAAAPEVASAAPQPLLMGVPAPALSAMVDAAATPMASDVDAAAPAPSSAASIPKIVRTAPTAPQRAPKKHK